MDPPFREIDHSGDVGIEACGSDMAELLENVTRGLFGLMCRDEVPGRVTRRIEVVSASAADLVVDWLSEVIGLASAVGEVYGRVQIDAVETGPATGAVTGDAGATRGWIARGTVAGEPVTAAHDMRFDVKAATYHGLDLQRRAGACRVRVIFDL